MADAICNTSIRFGKVIVPVAIKAAAESKDVSIGRAAPDGSKLCRIDVPDPGPEANVLVVDPLRRDKKGKVVQAQYDGEPLRGVWQGDKFHEIRPEDLTAINEETQIDEIEIGEFIPLRDVPWARVTGAYFLAAQEGFPAWPLALICKALKRKRAAGVVHFALRVGGRQKLGILHAVNGGLMLNTLHYAAEFARAESEIQLDDSGVSKVMVSLAEQIIEEGTRPVEVLDRYVDEVTEIKGNLVAEALAGQPLTRRPKRAKGTPVSTADALLNSLRASVEAAEARKPRKPAAPVEA